MSSATTTRKKSLTIFSLVMINVIAVDSLRSLPFSAEYGYSLVFYYLVGAIAFFLPVGLVSAELATAFPNKGGIYVWVREAFGEFWGFFVIWMQWVYNIAWYPTILSFVAGAIAYVIHPSFADSKLFILITVMSIFWMATLVNMFGMRLSGWISTAGAIFGTLIPMLMIITLAGVWLFSGKPIQIEFSFAQFWPDLSDPKILAFITPLLFGLVGLEMSAVHADEVDDPGRAYPRAIFYSSIIILSSLILSSLAIAIIIPKSDLSIYTGLLQAMKVFLESFHLLWLLPIVTILIVFGGMGGVATWIIGPTKGLLVAAQDGNAPAILARVNAKQVPIVILIIQAVIFTLLCSVFILMPNVTSSYEVLTAITAQLAMFVYIALFAAAIYLRYSRPEVRGAYRIPGGKVGIWIVGILGSLSSLVAIGFGFVTPPDIMVGHIALYEIYIITGILLLSSPPIIFYWRYHRVK